MIKSIGSCRDIIQRVLSSFKKELEINVDTFILTKLFTFFLTHDKYLIVKRENENFYQISYLIALPNIKFDYFYLWIINIGKYFNAWGNSFSSLRVHTTKLDITLFSRIYKSRTLLKPVKMCEYIYVINGSKN